MTFQSPNYTQTPNDLFDLHMANMSGGELKIVLAAVRKTIGFHKKREAISISQFQEMTGLSRRHVISAIDEAVAHGYIKEVGTGRRGTKKYELSIKEHTATSEIIAPVLVQKGNQSDTATSEIIAPTKEISTKRKEINKHIASDDAAVEKPQKPRAANPLFDAVALHVFGIQAGQVNGAGSRVGIIAAWLAGKSEKVGTRKIGFIPEPCTDPEQVRQFVQWYKRKLPRASVPRDLAKFSEYWLQWRAGGGSALPKPFVNVLEPLYELTKEEDERAWNGGGWKRDE